MDERVKSVGGKGHVVLDTAMAEEHKQAAQTCLRVAEEKLLSKPFLLVLDEILNTVGDKLLTEQKIIELVAKRGNTNVIMTGRGAAQKIIEMADLVTECKKIKHPYDEGKLAVAGLDY